MDYSIVINLDRDGGRALVDAFKDRAPSAAALEVLLRHGYVDEALRVLSRIVDADDSELLPGLKTANSTTRWWDDQRRRTEINAALNGIVERATAAASRRPREEAADIARQVLWVQTNIAPRTSRDTWPAHLSTFIEAYDGTAAARFAEVELLMARVPLAEKVETFERYAREHDGTLAGARALYEAAFQLGVNHAVTGIEPRGSDPTARLLRVAALANELESGRYPANEWVARAPTLVSGFFVSDSPAPSYAPGNVQRSLDTYGDFIKAHLTWRDPYPPNDSFGQMISHSMWKLWALQGEPRERADRFFDELAADPAAREAARFLQARAYLIRARDEPASGSALRVRAIDLLAELRDGSERVRQTAHAMLASELLGSGEDRRACDEFRRFIAAYPHSDWTWVASLRIGQCEEALQHWQIAALAYRRASTLHEDTPAAALLGHAYAARAFEAIGDFNAALNEYRQSIAAWFGRERTSYGLSIWRRTPAKPGAQFENDVAGVTKPALESRRADLSATIAKPGGALLERARWALRHGFRNDARDLAAQMLIQFPRSALARDARTVAHVADFEEALDLAAADSPRDVAGAKQQLDTLSREPPEVVVSLATLALASLMAVDGAPGSDELAGTVLEGWLKLQKAPPPPVPGSLEADADAVRRAVFHPLGGGIYGRHWNAMEWPGVLPPFLIAPATLPVQESDGSVRTLAASRPLPGLENTLYLSEEDFELMRRSITILGGSLRRVPASIMATPNQPAGPSQVIMKLWNRFFPMRPGHWGGWELASYPIISAIEFTNAARTKASVPVTIGYSGGTVLLEKIDGEWRVIEIVNSWIT